MSPPTTPEALWMATTVVGEEGRQKPLFNWPEKMLYDLTFLPELAATIAGGLWHNI